MEIPLFKTKHYYLWKLLLDEFFTDPYTQKRWIANPP